MRNVGTEVTEVQYFNPDNYFQNFSDENHDFHPKVVNIMKYRPNQIIVFEDEKIEYLYEILKGTVRSYKILDDGRRLITNFFTKGDIIGFPIDGTYFCSAEAITETTVCYHKMSQMKELMNSNVNLSQKIINMAFSRLSDAHEQMMTLGRKTPEERIATFLLYSQRWAMPDSHTHKSIINLPMSRLDIADYLGLTQETVCRVFSKFKRAGLITMQRCDQIIIANKDQLSELAGAAE